MAYTWKIDADARLAHVRAWGPFEIQETLAAPRSLATDPAFQPDFGVVVDLREIEYHEPAAEDVVAIGQNLVELRGLFRHRIAIVVSGSHELAVELSAAIAGAGGLEMSVFCDSEQARSWATEDGSP